MAHLAGSVEMLGLSCHTNHIAQSFFFSGLEIDMISELAEVRESSPRQVCQAIDGIIREIAPEWQLPEHDHAMLSNTQRVSSRTQSPTGRVRMSAFATYCLERVFAACSRPQPGYLRQIAGLLEMEYQQIQNWFRNQRAYRVANPVSGLNREMQARAEIVRELEAVNQDNRRAQAEIQGVFGHQAEINERLAHELGHALSVLEMVQANFGKPRKEAAAARRRIKGGLGFVGCTGQLPMGLADDERTIRDIEMSWVHAGEQR